MGKYLDPRADLTFKKVFGEHKNLVISLLNALLPLKDDERVESIEYWPADQIPERTEAEKYSIVDVCCKDNKQREFIVEMQMTWTESFKKRVLLNASKAYVAQTNKGMKYKNLQPVYALNFVNASFMKDVDDYYHYYHLVHDKYTDKVIDGLHLIFVELPKFKPQTISERKMQVLWLRYLTEIDENTREAPAELLENTEVNEALEILERAAFTDAEMRAYDKFWDRVSTMRTLESDWEDKIKEAKDKLNEMKAKAEEAEAKAEEAEAKAEEAEAKAEEAEAKAEEAEAKAEEAKAELKQKDMNTARRMKGLNVATDVISQVTGLSNAEIEAL
ncbi:MAG: Rpn family recombination-promoting nuclease/putative transposase [Prevotella sp.]|nr:Rpn family recombination-promoting nuclease/putative transposase [Prevotella sp.]